MAKNIMIYIYIYIYIYISMGIYVDKKTGLFGICDLMYTISLRYCCTDFHCYYCT